MTEPIDTPYLDLDDTTACPVAENCEGCADTDDLAVATAGTTLGVHCLTLCVECCAGPLPSLALLMALTRVGEHSAHLGIDLDVMAEAIDSEAAR